MGDYSKTIAWMDFPQGRVQYAGGKRGREEPPIETFAVDYHGETYFGEIGRRFLADRHSYTLEIVSFGWVTPDWVGTEPNPRLCVAFTLKELAQVQSLVCSAVRVWLGLEDRPPFLTEYGSARFTDEVIFRDGWALLKDNEEGA